MKKIKVEHILLLLIFLFILAFRMYFAFQVEYFNTDDAYFHLKYIEHILEKGTVMIYDPLSYGGIDVIYPHLFHILMALFSFGSVFMLKLIPELAISLTVFVVYLVSKDISGNSFGALFSSLLFGFYPLIFYETLNNLSIYTFILPLLLLMVYSLTRLDDKKYLWFFVLGSFLLPLLHPSSLLFVFMGFLYLFLLSGGALSSTRIKKEAIFFSSFLILLLQLLIYKKMILQHGLGLLWNNIPSNIFNDLFRQFSSTDLIFGLGLLPLVLGAFGVYVSVIREKKKLAYLLASFGLSVLILLFFRFLSISIGLIFLGLVLCVFSSSTFTLVYDYFSNFKFIRLRTVFVVVLIFSFIFLSFIPSYDSANNSRQLTDNKVKQIKWLSINTLPEHVILGNFEEGNLINYYGMRKNVIDTNFAVAPDPVVRYRDIELIYTTPSEALALDLLRKYNINFIYVSDETKEFYGINGLSYTKNNLCFESFREGRYYFVHC
ncbi:hypothetical protein J4216_01540 [Candidatus Woesearchaeota archaeon]|nr:hypothetical protein [Candidatus Woesearchaeota archaeon]